MPVAVLRHHEEDQPGLLGEAFESQGLDVAVTDVVLPGGGAARLPEPGALDAAVVLGSTWSVYDRAAVGGWIDAELDWMRAVQAAGVPLLGVCFGAQALTTAMGGRVERAPRSEIGWVGVRTLRPELVGEGPWFQFHGDRCLPPPSGEVVADNDLAVQAFRVGRALAVQFHPEVDAGQLGRWLDGGGREEVEAAGLDPDGLMAETSEREAAARRRAGALVEAFLRLPD